MLPYDHSLQLLLNLAIHQLSGLSVSVLNMQGVILLWNKGAQLLDGYEPSEIIGQPLNILHTPVARREQLSEYLLLSAMREGQVKNIGPRVKKDGSVYVASVLFNRILDEEGNSVGFIRIARELRGHEIE